MAKGRAAFNRGGRFTPELFEYGAYAAFQDTLADISRQCSDRDNYRLFHKVYVRRANVSDASVKPFELDVVAVLGYQIVVVSCTLAYEHARVKQKGMEAILRMRQLGGVEARAIVLCGASQEAQQLIQAELKEETGHSSLSLEIWGKDTWYRLQQTFHQYVRTALQLGVNTLCYKISNSLATASPIPSKNRYGCHTTKATSSAEGSAISSGTSLVSVSQKNRARKNVSSQNGVSTRNALKHPSQRIALSFAVNRTHRIRSSSNRHAPDNWTMPQATPLPVI